MSTSIFADLRVVELASVLAGPAVGQFFAELGASVLKIENRRTNGDVTRRWKAPTENPEQTDSAYYHSVNYGKEVLMLDLSEEGDREKAYEHIRNADIVLANYRTGGAEKLGMDYPTLSTLNPGLIYGEITGFGPGDKRPAFDVVLQAETGFIHLTGTAGGPPAKLPVALIDLLAAHQLKEGILIALMQRGRSGRGSKVSASLYDAAVASLANQATNWLIAGFSPQRIGTQHPNIAPYGDLFRTADDKLIVLAVGVEAHFSRLCQLLGCEELVEQPAFATNAARVQHRSELNEQLQAHLQHWERDAFLEVCAQRGIPAGAVRDLPEVFSQAAVQPLLLSGKNEAGERIQSVRTAVFTIQGREMNEA